MAPMWAAIRHRGVQSVILALISALRMLSATTQVATGPGKQPSPVRLLARRFGLAARMSHRG